MLSLPEDWDYTMKGLARICKDGIDSISGGIRELETHGYLVRARVRNENGQLGSIEYTILEQPKEPAQTPAPIREKPIRENPIQVKPMLDTPIQENPAQLNTKGQNKELSITQGSSPIPSSPPTPREKSRIGRDRMRERESYREIILENIDYDILIQDEKLDRDRLDELVELMVDTVSVSYTHLAVYKRQSTFLPIYYRKPPFPPFAGGFSGTFLPSRGSGPWPLCIFRLSCRCLSEQSW